MDVRSSLPPGVLYWELLGLDLVGRGVSFFIRIIIASSSVVIRNGYVGFGENFCHMF